jgi:hypothetical protein
VVPDPFIQKSQGSWLFLVIGVMASQKEEGMVRIAANGTCLMADDFLVNGTGLANVTW